MREAAKVNSYECLHHLSWDKNISHLNSTNFLFVNERKHLITTLLFQKEVPENLMEVSVFVILRKVLNKLGLRCAKLKLS